MNKSFKEYLKESEERINDTLRTQIKTTGSTYEKTGKYLKNLLPPKSKIINIGAGLEHTRQGLDKGLGQKKHTIHDHEPNPQNRKIPPEYTSADQIPKNNYNAAVSINVLNVLEPHVRNQVMKSLFDSVLAGGHIIIGVRKWTGDINTNKNFELGDEPKSMWVIKKNGNMSYQKGFDGDELKNYVEDYARLHKYNVTVKKLKNIAANAVHVIVNKKP